MVRKLGVGIAILAAVMLASAPLFSQAEKQEKKLVLKVLVPEKEAKVEINKKAYDGTGFEREIITVTNKKEITVSATWEPNGYTKFIRTRKFAVKDAKDGGTLTIDLKTADPKNPEDIQVIYVPTPQDVVEEMSRLAKIGKNDIVYDLGCGDGRMVITAVKQFNAKKGVGIDLNPERVKESQDNAKAAEVEKKVTFREGNVLEVKDLSDATVVMLYMGDFINERLRPILQKTLKPGSRVVSHRFLMGNWKPAQTVAYKGKNGYDYSLHLWVIGKGETKDEDK